jgi:hypothetical protein
MQKICKKEEKEFEKGLEGQEGRDAQQPGLSQ